MTSEIIKQFWENQGEKYNSVPFESLSNFEENSKTLQEKIHKEKEVVFSKLPLSQDDTILDLGSGVGQWSFRLAKRAKEVVAVEYTPSLINIAHKEQQKRLQENIKFIHSSAEDFLSEDKFDVIFISGLIVYLTDSQVKKMLKNIKKMIKKNTKVFLREPTSIQKNRYIINNEYSEALRANYSATYRTTTEYTNFFEDIGFKLIKKGPFFEEGSILNKFPETRLYYYLFSY